MSTPSNETSHDTDLRRIKSDVPVIGRSGISAEIAALAIVGLAAINGCVAGQAKPKLPSEVSIPGGEMPSPEKVLAFVQKESPDATCRLADDRWYFRDNGEGGKTVSNTLFVICDRETDGSSNLSAPLPGETLPTKLRKPGKTTFHIDVDCKNPTFDIDKKGLPFTTSCKEVTGVVDKYDEGTDKMTILIPLAPELLKPSSPGHKAEQTPHGVTMIVSPFANQLGSVAAHQLGQPVDSLRQSIGWERPVNEARPPSSLMINFNVDSSLSKEKTFFCPEPKFQQKSGTIVVATKTCDESTL